MIIDIITLICILAVASFIAGYAAAAFEKRFEDLLFCTIAGVLVGLMALLFVLMIMVPLRLLLQYLIG